MIAQLKSAASTLEKEIATATESTALARAARDEAAREVLRLEPIGVLGHAGIPAAIVLGALSGLLVSSWWFGLSFSAEWPRTAAGLALGASTVVLLRGAWHSGRVAGARGPR